MGVNTEGGLMLKLSSSEKRGLLERGGLNRGFKILLLLVFCLSAVKNKVNSVSIVCNIAIQSRSMVYFTYYLGCTLPCKCVN